MKGQRDLVNLRQLSRSLWAWIEIHLLRNTVLVSRASNVDVAEQTLLTVAFYVGKAAALAME
jgi:hypothetical protein